MPKKAGIEIKVSKASPAASTIAGTPLDGENRSTGLRPQARLSDTRIAGRTGL